MKHFISFIVGIAVTIGGAALYDFAGPGAAPGGALVNWTTAGSLVDQTVHEVRSQFDRLVKQLGG
jgi:hypothetical protein